LISIIDHYEKATLINVGLAAEYLTLFKHYFFQVMELDLLSLDSVVKFADAWNARMAPLHVLINNAGIFAIGGLCT
jgi:NAD(P)-dependent dehydrogenase (short-subunit alcohol dehydrogenase family)